MQDLSPAAVRQIDGLNSVIDRYDAVILDLWGVVHDGIRPYPGVVDCLRALKSAGKGICLLSNAPRRADDVAAKLNGMGIAPDSYDLLMTSGEASHWAIRQPIDDWHAALGQRCYHLGPPRDDSLFDDLPVTRVDDVADADFVVNTGIDAFNETLEMYEPVLRAAAERALPMVCANPDLIVTYGDAIAICAGTLAARYEELGGDVRYHGKPYAPVYRTCLDRLGIGNMSRVLAVGDSLRTDIAGARAAGLGSALVTGGIHREELGAAWGTAPSPDRLAQVVRAAGHRPDYALTRLAWA